MECVELALLLELLYAECGYNQAEMPFNKLVLFSNFMIFHAFLSLLASEKTLAKRRMRGRKDVRPRRGLGVNLICLKTIQFETNEKSIFFLTFKYWQLLQSDQKIINESLEKFKDLRGLRFVNERVQEAMRRILREEKRPNLAKVPSQEESKPK